MGLATVAHTRRGTTARVAAEYRALDRVVRVLGTARLERAVPGFGARARIRREQWTGKDALAHIVEWKRQALRALRHEPSDPQLRGRTIAVKNRLLYERWHGRTARAVVAYHRAVQREIDDALRALPESYFAKRRSPYWPNDLLGHAAGHRRRHLEPMLTPARRAGRASRASRAERGSPSRGRRARPAGSRGRPPGSRRSLGRTPGPVA